VTLSHSCVRLEKNRWEHPYKNTVVVSSWFIMRNMRLMSDSAISHYQYQQRAELMMSLKSKSSRLEMPGFPML
jgi:hypothetical protein